MRLTDTAAHAALDAVLPAGTNNGQLSLHSAFSATGASLLGSKTNATFVAASGRAKLLSAPVDITVPSAATVRWIGAWSADGTTFKGMLPNGGTAKPFQVDLTNNRILCESHGFSTNDHVAFFGDTIPTGLTEGTEYYVIGAATGDPDYFQVSATEGGSAIDITGQQGPASYVAKMVPEVYSGAGTHRVNTYSLAA